MHYCYHDFHCREQEGGALGLAAVFFYFFLYGIVELCKAQTLGWGIVCVGLMTFGLYFCCFMIKVYLEISRKYTVTQDGLVLHYPFRFTVTHSWEELSEIGICNVQYANRGQPPVPHLTAIRCVVGEEKNGPRTGYGSWASAFYSAIHFRRIIIILYTENRLEEFKKECPLKVVDYRDVKRWGS